MRWRCFIPVFHSLSPLLCLNLAMTASGDATAPHTCPTALCCTWPAVWCVSWLVFDTAGPDPHTLCNVKGGVWAVRVTAFNLLEKRILWSSYHCALFTAGIQYIQYTYPCMPTMRMRHGCITRTRYRTPKWRPFIPVKVAHTTHMPKSYPCLCDVLPTAHQFLFPWICQPCRLYIDASLWNSLSGLWNSFTKNCYGFKI